MADLALSEETAEHLMHLDEDTMRELEELRVSGAPLVEGALLTRTRTRFGALRSLELSHCGGVSFAQLADAALFTYEESLPWLRYVRTHGVLQFISILQRQKAFTNDELLWGDEIEYHLVSADADAKTARLLLRADEVRKELSDKEEARWRPCLPSDRVSSLAVFGRCARSLATRRRRSDGATGWARRAHGIRSTAHGCSRARHASHTAASPLTSAVWNRICG